MSDNTPPGIFDFPSHYRTRLQMIDFVVNRLPDSVTRTVVLLGDSITEAHPARELGGLRVINQGISGDQAAHPEGGILRRIDRLAPARPAHVFLLVGINDLNDGKPVAKYLGEMRDLVREIKSSVTEAKLHLQSILPTRDAYAHLLKSVQESNAGLQKIARAEEVGFLDLFPTMADEDHAIREELTTDGVHLTNAAYDVWIQALEEYLAARRQS